MPVSFIAVGSNIEPEKNIPKALRLLAGKARFIDISRFYLTDPIGPVDSPSFYNGVVEIYTDLNPRDLKYKVLRKIEDELGRTRDSDKNAPRTIDLDIVVYGDTAIQEDDLVVPHPDVYTRAFIASPMSELAPNYVLPDSGRTISDIASSLQNNQMHPLVEFSNAIRETLNEP